MRKNGCCFLCVNGVWWSVLHINEKIKNNIEKLCQHAKKMASIYHIKDAVFAHKIKKDLFCTIKIDNNNVYF